jgi:hypothetical protein
LSRVTVAFSPIQRSLPIRQQHAVFAAVGRDSGVVSMGALRMRAKSSGCTRQGGLEIVEPGAGGIP